MLGFMSRIESSMTTVKSTGIMTDLCFNQIELRIWIKKDRIFTSDLEDITERSLINHFKSERSPRGIHSELWIIGVHFATLIFLYFFK